MRTINLDETRTAEDRPTVVFGGKTYELPAELPISIVVAIQSEDIAGAIRGLFGKDAAKVLEAGLSVKDLDRIVKNCYGLAPAEGS